MAALRLQPHQTPELCTPFKHYKSNIQCRQRNRSERAVNSAGRSIHGSSSILLPFTRLMWLLGREVAAARFAVQCVMQRRKGCIAEAMRWPKSQILTGGTANEHRRRMIGNGCSARTGTSFCNHERQSSSSRLRTSQCPSGSYHFPENGKFLTREQEDGFSDRPKTGLWLACPQAVPVPRSNAAASV